MSVYRALQPAQFLPRLTSAAPFRLSGTFIKFSRLGQIWPFIQLLMLGPAFYFNRKYLPHFPKDLKTLLSESIIWLQYFIAIFGILRDGLCQKNIIEIVESMDNYDRTTGYSNDINGNSENERVRLWSFAYSAVIVIFAVGRYCTWNIIRLDIFTEIFAMQIDNSIYMFVVLTTLLGLRFRHLNSIIEETRVTIVQEKSASKSSSESTNPEYIRELYTSLVEIGERLNEHYSSRLLLWSADMMLSFVSRSFYLLTEKVTTLFVAATVVRLLPLLLDLLLFSRICQFTVEQANTITSSLLEKNIRHTARIDRGRKEIFTMSLYMALRPFEFSALGFFTVDFSLTYTIVTISMTYVTLCIQSMNSDIEH